MKLPYATPDETTLSATRGYRVMESDLRDRLSRAVMAAEGARTDEEREEAEAEVLAVHRAIDDYEAEQRELDDERRRDAMLTTKQEVTP